MCRHFADGFCRRHVPVSVSVSVSVAVVLQDDGVLGKSESERRKKEKAQEGESFTKYAPSKVTEWQLSTLP